MATWHACTLTLSFSLSLSLSLTHDKERGGKLIFFKLKDDVISRFVWAFVMATVKEVCVSEVKKWTRTLPAVELRPNISWDDIEAYHTGFSCVENARKYLDNPTDLILMYPQPHTPFRRIFKVSMPSFWKKGSRRIVYISYDEESVKWGLCSCTRKFVIHFIFFQFLIPCRNLGICIHTAVAMIFEWRKRNPDAFSLKYQ